MSSSRACGHDGINAGEVAAPLALLERRPPAVGAGGGWAMFPRLLGRWVAIDPVVDKPHSSTPWLPSLAAKNSVPLTFVRLLGRELAAPGKMSLSRTVPVEVPLLCHSSRP